MPTPNSSATKQPKRSRRPRHDAATTKPNSKRARKQSSDRGKLEVLDDWNQQDISGWLAPSAPPEDPMQFKAWEQQGRVDRLREMIPFWREGVIAAHKGGEVAKLEDFLRRLEEEEKKSWEAGGWGNDVGEDVWGPSGRDQNDGWAVPPSGAGRGWDSVEDEGWGPAGQQGWVSPAAEQGWVGAEQDEAAWGNATDYPVTAARRPDGNQGHSEDTSASAWGGRRNKTSGRKRGDSWAFVEKVAQQEDASSDRRQSMHEFYAMPTQEKLKKIREVVQYLQAQNGSLVTV
ncbi:hypothetical protein BXZ70DRAFT_780489 [Cristinia sonorae]|uniref:Uncharacterized protein n=1 Tax=Cristinia sonorae TaxID=1940300 RepID=A0A8K0UR05_9AGAR|nr:hypothetical protein BXZ70DRAFT_780489 [Cristinia sonorae]